MMNLYCPNCGATRIRTAKTTVVNRRRHECLGCGVRFSNATAEKATSAKAPRMAAAKPAVCPNCGKPITGSYRKGSSGKKEHLSCPKPEPKNPRKPVDTMRYNQYVETFGNEGAIFVPSANRIFAFLNRPPLKVA